MGSKFEIKRVQLEGLQHIQLKQHLSLFFLSKSDHAMQFNVISYMHVSVL